MKEAATSRIEREAEINLFNESIDNSEGDFGDGEMIFEEYNHSSVSVWSTEDNQARKICLREFVKKIMNNFQFLMGQLNQFL
jgi:elongation factor P hydroxylase